MKVSNVAKKSSSVNGTQIQFFPSFSEDFFRSAMGKLIHLQLLLAVVSVIGLEEIQQLLKLNCYN